MRPSKRDELLQNALVIFYRNGFHATGMDMLSAEIGLSKTSIYNHFRTKEDLILAVLRLRDEQFRHWLFRRMDELGSANHGGPREQLLAMYDALGEWFDQKDFKGCMFIKAAAEYQEADHPIHKQSADHKQMLETHILKLVKKAKLRLPDMLARQLLQIKEGAIVTAQLGHTQKPAQDAKYTAQCLIDAHDTSKRKPVQTSFGF